MRVLPEVSRAVEAGLTAAAAVEVYKQIDSKKTATRYLHLAPLVMALDGETLNSMAAFVGSLP